MHDLVLERVHLAYLSKDFRVLKEYLEDLTRFKFEITSENEKQYIMRNLSSQHSGFNKIHIQEQILAWEYFQVNEYRNYCATILKINQELETYSCLEMQEAIIQLHQCVQFLLDGYEDKLIELKKTYQKKSKIPLFKSRSWKDSSCVFHAIKLQYILEIISEGKIHGRTGQRYWDDGKRRKDNDPEYNDSYWMKGISTTRSLEYAANWADIVLVLDLEVIKKNKEVVPYAWNYLMSHDAHNKKETEEFIVLAKKKRKYIRIEDPEFKKEYDEAMESGDDEIIKIYQNMAQKPYQSKDPEGFIDLNKCLKGIFLVGDVVDIFGGDNQVITELLKHPKFLGILER